MLISVHSFSYQVLCTHSVDGACLKVLLEPVLPDTGMGFGICHKNPVIIRCYISYNQSPGSNSISFIEISELYRMSCHCIHMTLQYVALHSDWISMYGIISLYGVISLFDFQIHFYENAAYEDDYLEPIYDVIDEDPVFVTRNNQYEEINEPNNGFGGFMRRFSCC